MYSTLFCFCLNYAEKCTLVIQPIDIFSKFAQKNNALAITIMKKIFVFLLIVMISLSAHAQYDTDDYIETDTVAAELGDDVCREICGVEFGTDFETAKAILENKFGREVGYADRNWLIFTNQTYAGVFFNELHFCFQGDGRNTYFNKCVLCISSKSAEEAKKNRDFLYKVLNEKYYMTSQIADDKFKYYLGGTSPTDEDRYGFEISIAKNKYDWKARVFYGPYNFVKEEF